MSGPLLSVVLPTWNEAENIGPLIRALEEALCGVDYELLVVDDDSPDGTWRIAGDSGRAKGRTRVMRRTGERGLTSAINAGIQNSRGSLVAWMDCDLSHPPELLPSLLAAVTAGADAAVASRFAPGGLDARSGKYGLQRFLSLLLMRLSQVATGLPVRDITSGYIVVRKYRLLDIGGLNGDYGEYFIDMVSRLRRTGCRMVEIPYTFKNREAGESKTATSALGYARRGLRYLAMLVRHNRWRGG